MDMNSLLYVALGAILIPFLAKLGIKVPLPGPSPTPGPTPDPNTPAPAPFNLSVLINAIVTALIERFLPLVKETVRTELANRPVVTPADQPKIEQLADGSFRFIPAAAPKEVKPNAS